MGLEALYLLIPGDASRTSGGAAAAAMIAAERFARGRDVLLMDLDTWDGSLTTLAGGEKNSGLAAALEQGLSPQDAGFLVCERVRFVTIRRAGSNGVGILDDPDLPRFIAAATLLEMRVLVYLPADENLERLARLAGGALLLVRPDEEVRLRARLPASLRVVGVIEPPADATTTHPESADVAPSADEAVSSRTFASILRTATENLAEEGRRSEDRRDPS